MLAGGYSFEIYSDTNNSNTIDSGDVLVQTVTTSSNGKVVSSPLLVGEYVVIEINTPAQFVVPSEIAVTVSPGQHSQVKFYNYYKQSDLQIVKTGDNPSNHSDIPVYMIGVEFTIFHNETEQYVTFDETSGVYIADGESKNQNDKTTVTTNAGGRIYLEDLKYGTYTITEIKTSEGYLVAAPIQFTVSDDGAKYEVGIYNEIITGSVELYKAREDLATANDDYYKLANQSFYYERFTIAEETSNTTFQTDENGYLLIEDLKYGEYELCEGSLPSNTVTYSDVLTTSNDTANDGVCVDFMIDEAFAFTRV